MKKADCYKSEKVSFTPPITFFANFGELCYLDVTSIENPSLKSELQLVINKHLETYNVALIRKYQELYAPLNSLARILKKWNKSIYPDNTRRLSSHAIVLMLIAYLQHIGILPRL